MPLASGTTLGPYEIQAPLGAGGMGEVYRARDTRLDRTVAIKVLPEHVAADLKQRFEREAKTVAALSHPHICPVFDVGEQDGVNYLVMEYLDGETLAQRLEKGALPLDQALTVAIEIADALDKAHRQGIVHRDLKPGEHHADQVQGEAPRLRPRQAQAGDRRRGGVDRAADAECGPDNAGDDPRDVAIHGAGAVDGKEADARTES